MNGPTSGLSGQASTPLRYRDLVRGDLLRLRPGARCSPAHIAVRCIVSPETLASVVVRALQVAHQRGWGTAANAFRTLGIVLAGIDVLPGARLGQRIQFAHPVGVVIGNGAVIGDDVTFAGGVTLGTRNPGPQFGPQNYPVIGDRVVLGSHCVVLGAVTVGADAVVAAHAVVLDDVPSGTVVAGAPARPVGREA